MSVLSKPYFHDEKAAFEKLEQIVWPNGPVCPHCGNKGEKPVYDLSKTRVGLKKCGACRKQFTVRVGTVFESSHIPLHKWLQATHLLCSSKKGISAHQLHRVLEITYKSAWFMAHRLREAMRDGKPLPLGGEGKIVEVDETYIGKKGKSGFKDVLLPGKGWVKRGTGNTYQFKIVSLVERGGRARSVHVPYLTASYVRKVLKQNVLARTDLMSDSSNVYNMVGREFASHETVNHSIAEYARGLVHTNTIEGFFSIFKRGMRGVYQHCSEKHLHRYLAEFDFRYSERKVTDGERAESALKGIQGKRLTYRVVGRA